MMTRVLLLLLLSSLLFSPILSKPSPSGETAHSELLFSRKQANQGGPRVLLPVYVRLQARQRIDVTLWESLPQNYTDHVATIDSKVLAMFVSSNSLGFNLSRDNVGNLWMAANYSLNTGDYMSTLTWMSSKTVSENLDPLGFVPFPQSYPEDVETFLNPGRKMPSKNQTIQEIAASLNQTQNNMTQTVRNVLDFVSTQGYDRDKTRLLLSGNLNTTSILDFFEDALEVLETNSSMCLERSFCAAAILRAAGVPTRTVTDVRLKTWIQVWLGEYGWVDAEALCVQPPPRFPRPLSSSTPWMIENSSDAAFPFTWVPEVSMRVANLTFEDPSLFDITQYRTVLSEPVDAEQFEKEPTKFSFPIVFTPDLVYAAITQRESSLTFSLVKGNENASKTLTLGESNIIALGDIAVSFIPFRQENFLILQDFSVQEVWKFDFRILVPVVGIPAVIAFVWFYFRRRRRGR